MNYRDDIHFGHTFLVRVLRNPSQPRHLNTFLVFVLTELFYDYKNTIVVEIHNNTYTEEMKRCDK